MNLTVSEAYLEPKKFQIVDARLSSIYSRFICLWMRDGFNFLRRRKKRK